MSASLITNNSTLSNSFGFDGLASIPTTAISSTSDVSATSSLSPPSKSKLFFEQPQQQSQQYQLQHQDTFSPSSSNVIHSADLDKHQTHRPTTFNTDLHQSVQHHQHGLVNDMQHSTFGDNKSSTDQKVSYFTPAAVTVCTDGSAEPVFNYFSYIDQTNNRAVCIFFLQFMSMIDYLF